MVFTTLLIVTAYNIIIQKYFWVEILYILLVKYVAISKLHNFT